MEYGSKSWVVLQPRGKSQQVFGGIGSVKLPPNEYGFRLVTLSGGHNASSGIPALISHDIWDYYKLRDGNNLTARAKWQPMPVGWAERFPSIKGIPKGCLVITNISQLSIVDDEVDPVQFHPCTVMEYEKGNSILYDFVYATLDTGMRSYRKNVEKFFEKYRTASNRYGKYPLSSDVADPLWEAEYMSPADLIRTEAGAESQLELIQARVRNESFKGRNLETIIEILNVNYDVEGLKRVSTIIGISPSLWYRGGRLAAASADLLQECVKKGKVEELIDKIAIDYPESFS